MVTELSDNEKRGRNAEILFSDFLNENKIPFTYVDQSIETVSKEMRDNHIRRPDFIVHTKYCLYFIDVKCRDKQTGSFGKERRFYLNQGEVESLNELQDKLLSNVWIAFIDDKDDNKFYYAPIIRIYEYYEYILNGFLEKSEKIIEDSFFLYIPDDMLYDHFSSEKGFYRSTDTDYSPNDIDHHVNKMRERVRINSYK